ncbi:MAG: hypothetical protein CR971_00395 [candidate division SR1 bacterium]|nr:MAG: hypothetical protein CR971_00395 [candidate division SR1 bacterium]
MKKIKLISSILILVFFASCEKEILEINSIAQRVTIESDVSSDTIVLDEYENPDGYVSVKYKIIGLEKGEYFEMYSSHNGKPEKLVILGEEYQIFDKKNNEVYYTFYVEEYEKSSHKDIRTILKFKFSDGSEKWIEKKVKIKIDSSLYKMRITPEFYMEFDDKEEREFVLSKGQNFQMRILIDNIRRQNSYIVARYKGFYQGEWKRTSVIETNEEEPLYAQRKITIPFTKGIDFKKMTIKVVGRYNESNYIKFNIRYK